jgi:hypothetical protein
MRTMGKAKVAITLEEETLEKVDRLIKLQVIWRLESPRGSSGAPSRATATQDLSNRSGAIDGRLVSPYISSKRADKNVQWAT